MPELLAIGESLPGILYIMSQTVDGGVVANASAKVAVNTPFGGYVSHRLLCLRHDESPDNCTTASTNKS